MDHLLDSSVGRLSATINLTYFERFAEIDVIEAFVFIHASKNYERWKQIGAASSLTSMIKVRCYFPYTYIFVYFTAAETTVDCRSTISRGTKHMLNVF